MADKIAETLNVQPTEYPLPSTNIDPVDFETKVREFRENAIANATYDFQESRDNLRQIIASGMEMLEDVKAVVSETQSDKAIGAASCFMKTLGDLSVMLVKLNLDTIKNPPIKGNKDQQNSGDLTVNNSNVIIADTSKILSSSKERNFGNNE